MIIIRIIEHRTTNNVEECFEDIQPCIKMFSSIDFLLKSLDQSQALFVENFQVVAIQKGSVENWVYNFPIFLPF